MRIPSAEQLASYCMTTQYRRCDIFRQFLTTLAERPERWPAVTAFGTGPQRVRNLKGE